MSAGFLRRRSQPFRAVLTYHSIDPSGSVISMDELAFSRHVEFLASGRVHVLPLSELVDDRHSAAHEDAVALTFDDGFTNFATSAWPLLKDNGLPVTLFVVPDRVGLDNRWGGRADLVAPTLDLLGWDDLGRLAEEGVSIGSHSRSHPRLDLVRGSALADEVAGSADAIEARLGRRPTSFCFPYGAHDTTSVAAVAQVYEQAVTTRMAVLDGGADPHRLPRLDCYYLRDPGKLEQWGSLRLRARLQVRAALRAARESASRLGRTS